MTTFPRLAPSTRAYTPGDYPATAFTSLSGEQSRVRHSTIVLGSRLELTYERLSEADRQAIETHYHGSQGEFLPFTLAPEVWSGFVPLTVDPAGWWRYAEPPEVEDFCGPTATVRIVLISAPGGGAPGAALGPVVVGMVGGEPSRNIAGATRTITVSFLAGAATGSNLVGPALLLHMEGTDTTIVDSSANPKTITLGSGSTQDITQSTTQKRFGSKGLYFPSGRSWMLASGIGIAGGDYSGPVTPAAFTLEMFFWLSSAAASARKTAIFSTDIDGYRLNADYYGPAYTGPGAGSGGLEIFDFGNTGTLATESWHYLKITRGTNRLIRFFVNGVEHFAGDGSLYWYELSTLYLGQQTYSSTESMKGYIDEVRIRPEVDNSLTVPTEAFPDP